MKTFKFKKKLLMILIDYIIFYIFQDFEIVKIKIYFKTYLSNKYQTI